MSNINIVIKLSRNLFFGNKNSDRIIENVMRKYRFIGITEMCDIFINNNSKYSVLYNI